MGRNRHQVHHLDMVEMGEDSGSVFDPWEGTETGKTVRRRLNAQMFEPVTSPFHDY